MVIQLLYTQSITLDFSVCRKQACLCKMSPPSATPCCMIGHLVVLLFVQRLFASVRNSFCWTKSVHLQYFCKYIVSYRKHVAERLVKSIPHTQHHVKEKYTEPWLNIRSQFQCWTNTKYECLYDSWFFFFFAQFTLNADINNQSNEQGITEVPVQFVVFLLHVLKVWIHRTHVLQINKFWVLR